MMRCACIRAFEFAFLRTTVGNSPDLQSRGALNTTSQEVTALLKRDHGIEVKSASSTIEEVVARQFVERLARQRNIALPSGDIFAETPVPKGKKGTPPKKAAEPAKPAAPYCRRPVWSRQ